MKTFLAFLTLVAFLLHTSSSIGAEKPRIELDIPYAKVPHSNGKDEKELKLDLAIPEGKGPFPLVVVVHGGAWRMGNKKDVRSWISLLAEQGFVAASVSYRLAPDYVFPAQIEDVKTAVRFLRSQKAKYKINPDKVGALGFSAGGHLVALLGLTDAKAGFEGKLYPEESSEVQCVVDFFGPIDLTEFGKDDSAQRSMLAPFIGAKYSEKPELHLKASVTPYIHKKAPPFLIIHGDKDWIVPVSQSQNFAKKLKEEGVEVEYLEIRGGGHGWDGIPQESFKSTKATLEFLTKHLKK